MTQPYGIDTSVLVRLVTTTPDPDGYSRSGLETLTLDRQMATLPGVRRL